MNTDIVNKYYTKDIDELEFSKNYKKVYGRTVSDTIRTLLDSKVVTKRVTGEEMAEFMYNMELEYTEIYNQMFSSMSVIVNKVSLSNLTGFYYEFEYYNKIIDRYPTTKTKGTISSTFDLDMNKFTLLYTNGIISPEDVISYLTEEVIPNE